MMSYNRDNNDRTPTPAATSTSQTHTWCILTKKSGSSSSEQQGHNDNNRWTRHDREGGEGQGLETHESQVLRGMFFFLPFFFHYTNDYLLINVGYALPIFLNTSKPSNVSNSRKISLSPDTLPPQCIHTSSTQGPGGDEGSRPACFKPLEVCFFKISLYYFF